MKSVLVSLLFLLADEKYIQLIINPKDEVFDI